MLEKKCSEFINDLASDLPVPGGGSAAALAGAIGMALGTMVGELTVGKKKYAEYETEISNLIFRARQITDELQDAVQADIDAFTPLAKAYKMPSATEEEKRMKKEAVQKALLPAAEAPLNLAELCVKALRVLDSFSLIGNKQAISDIGTGSALCEAALKGAKLNALINISLMKDEELKKKLEDKLDATTDTGIHLASITYARVEKECR